MRSEMDWSSVVSAAVVFGAGVIAGVFLRRRAGGGIGSNSGQGIGNPLGSILNPLDARKLRLAAIRATNLTRSHKMIMVVRNDLGMGKGKIAAQCAHAAVMCYQKAQATHEKDLDIWEATGCTKICVKIDDGEEGLKVLQRQAKERNLVNALVHDAGHTQIAAGTATVLGLGPAPAEDLAEITSKFKLL